MLKHFLECVKAVAHCNNTTIVIISHEAPLELSKCSKSTQIMFFPCSSRQCSLYNSALYISQTLCSDRPAYFEQMAVPTTAQKPFLFNHS